MSARCETTHGTGHSIQKEGVCNLLTTVAVRCCYKLLRLWNS